MLLCLLLLIIGILFYFRMSLLVWTGTTLVLLLLWSRWGNSGVALLIIAWTIYLSVAIIFNFRGLRRKLITRHILPIYQHLMPSMSQTEKEAIQAGTVGFEAELFQGAPNWEKFVSKPLAQLTQEEQSFIDNEVEALCRMIDDWQITHELLDIPPNCWEYIKTKGFFGLNIDKAYQGKGFSAYAQSEILMRLYSRSTTLACIVAVPNSLGPGELLHYYGTEAQKNYYLPRLAAGLEIPCFALTSPVAGSDAASITDHGIVTKGIHEGKEVLGLKLTWNKRYITLAPVATLIGLAFKLYDPDHLLSSQVERGITCALIPTHWSGVKHGARHFPLNIPFQNGPTEGHDVFIPLDFIIGGAAMIGQGWRMLMECLCAGRAITLPTGAISQMKMVTHTTGAYARIRRQFNVAIGNFEGVEDPLSRIGGSTYYLNAARVMALSAIVEGEKPPIVSAIMKYHATETGRLAICDGMDIHGGKGICLGPHNYLGRFYEGAPIMITVEGANILTRNLIIFGQGAIRCHPYALKELQAAQLSNPKMALKAFDQVLFKHIGYSLSNIVRSLWLSVTDGIALTIPVHGVARRFVQKITRISCNFALLSDVAMLTLGAELKRKESLSARLGDVLSYLYLASGTVKYFLASSVSEEEILLFQYGCQHLLAQARQRLTEILRELPNRPVAWLLRALIWPQFGVPYHEPSDALKHKIARFLMIPSEARQRLIHGIDQCNAPNNPIHLLSITLTAVVKNEALEKRFLQAVKEGQARGYTLEDQLNDALTQGVITQVEAQDYREMQALRMQVINVDAFAPGTL